MKDLESFVFQHQTHTMKLLCQSLQKDSSHFSFLLNCESKHRLFEAVLNHYYEFIIHYSQAHIQLIMIFFKYIELIPQQQVKSP